MNFCSSEPFHRAHSSDLEWHSGGFQCVLCNCSLLQILFHSRDIARHGRHLESSLAHIFHQFHLKCDPKGEVLVLSFELLELVVSQQDLSWGSLKIIFLSLNTFAYHDTLYRFLNEVYFFPNQITDITDD